MNGIASDIILAIDKFKYYSAVSPSKYSASLLKEGGHQLETNLANELLGLRLYTKTASIPVCHSAF